jgi:hypothetical protein
MAQLDDLPADQRAALQLILRQGRSYDEIAGLLKMEPRAVRERARSALDALGPADPEGLELDEQDEVADFLLGQQSAARRAETRALLERSAPARAWARTVAAELRPLGGDDLPEVPEEGGAAPAAAAVAAGPAPIAAPVPPTRDHDHDLDHDDEPVAAPARDPRTTGAGARVFGGADRTPKRRSSRLGGLILLGALALALVGAIVALATSGGDDDDEPAASASTPASTAAGSPIVGAVNLRAGEGGQGARGVLFALRQGEGVGLAISVERVQPAATEQGPYYAIWYTGPGVPARRAGFPNPQPTTQADRRIQQLVPLPEQLTEPRLENARRYDSLLVTRETDRDPSAPGEVVLRGGLGELRRALARAPGAAGTGTGTSTATTPGG